MDPEIKFYERHLPDGGVTHVVRTVDDVITNQFLYRERGNALDMGHGHPEWVGQPVVVLRGKGFTRARGERYTALIELTTEQ
jgi:hypothetical protein